MSYHTNDTRLVPNKGHSIVERDEAGNIIGAYTGYWNPSRQLVTLYPDYRHPAVKAGQKLNKRQIYDGLVRCKKADASPAKVKDGAKSQTSRAMKDLIGQEKIKF
jgi:hypothetical protein